MQINIFCFKHNKQKNFLFKEALIISFTFHLNFTLEITKKKRERKKKEDCFIDRLKEEEEKNTTQVSSKQESN
jgi:hypothetical protein